MCIRKTSLRIVCALLGLLVLLGAVAALYHFRPLFPLRSYKATVETPTAGKTSMKVRSMLGRPSWIFVNVPETHLDAERPWNRWFIWDVRSDSVSQTWVGESPYLHRRHDQGRGIGLLNPKMEDSWRVERSGGGIRFSNDRQTITIEPSAP